jgi:DNA polymerase-1
MSRFLTLAAAISEAHALGATFTVAGDAIERHGELPAALAATLDANKDLWPDFFDTEADDQAALTFFRSLCVELVHITEESNCPKALAQLDHDAAEHGLPIAIDLETAALSVPRKPRRIRLTKDGCLAANQRPPQATGEDTGHDDSKDALSPRTGYVAVLQLYAGGGASYIFTDDALAGMLRSRWLHTRSLVAHNAKFESTWLDDAWTMLRRSLRSLPPWDDDFAGETPGTLHCSLQACGLLIGVGFAGEKRSLENAAKELLGLDVPKALANSDWGLSRLTAGQLAYAAGDPVVGWRLWQVAWPELERLGRSSAYFIQLGCAEATAAMEQNGLGINPEKFALHLDNEARKLGDARAGYQAKTGKPAPDTPAEIRAWLSDLLTEEEKRRWKKTAKDGLLSIEEGAINRLYERAPEARDVIKLIRTQKLIRSFGRKFIAKLSPATGRMHANYRIAGTKTGRFACDTPNLQQLPANKAPAFREIVEAHRGHKLICADYSQIEFRIVGNIAKDDAVNAIYLPGGSGDIHAEIAAMVNDIPITDVTKDQRNAAKAITFGAIYGMGAAGMSAYAHASYDVDMDEDTARDALNRFFDRFRGIRRWRRDNANQCQARGYIKVPTSGRIIHKDWEVEGTLRFTLMCNAPVQGAAGDLIMVAMRLVHQRMQHAPFYGYEGLVASIHDELIVEAREENASLALDILRQSMIDAFVELFPGAPTDGLVNAAIVDNWGQFK